jgi:hypothetical protein
VTHVSRCTSGTYARENPQRLNAAGSPARIYSERADLPIT